MWEFIWLFVAWCLNMLPDAACSRPWPQFSLYGPPRHPLTYIYSNLKTLVLSKFSIELYLFFFVKYWIWVIFVTCIRSMTCYKDNKQINLVPTYWFPVLTNFPFPSFTLVSIRLTEMAAEYLEWSMWVNLLQCMKESLKMTHPFLSLYMANQ